MVQSGRIVALPEGSEGHQDRWNEKRVRARDRQDAPEGIAHLTRRVQRHLLAAFPLGFVSLLDLVDDGERPFCGMKCGLSFSKLLCRRGQTSY